jgi:hypothetical protein
MVFRSITRSRRRRQPPCSEAAIGAGKRNPGSLHAYLLRTMPSNGDSGTAKGRRPLRRRAAAGAVALAVCLACAGAEPARVEQERAVEQEVSRLEATAAGIDRGSLPEPLAVQLDGHREALAAVRLAASPELRLYQLAAPLAGIETVAFFSRHGGAAGSLDELERLWTSLGPRFRDLPAGGDGSLRGALVDTAATRAARLYRASLQYGRISSPMSGLYYLAEAEGNRRLVELLAGVPAAPGDVPAPPGEAALVAAADELEAEARAALAADPVRGGLIPVNVRLDEAREMIEAARPAGAALQLLEARLQLGRLAGPPAEPPPAPAPGPADAAPGSLAALLRAMAEEAGEGERARIAREALLPMYASMLADRPAGSADAHRTVTLTLVRWPYT